MAKGLGINENHTQKREEGGFLKKNIHKLGAEGGSERKSIHKDGSEGGFSTKGMQHTPLLYAKISIWFSTSLKESPVRNPLWCAPPI